MSTIPILAYAIDLGWLRIGPPYIYINIDPILFHIGPLALHWYGLMYALAIVVGLQVIRGYTTRIGITQAMVYRITWWCVIFGLIGGRLLFTGHEILRGPGLAMAGSLVAAFDDLPGQLWVSIHRLAHQLSPNVPRLDWALIPPLALRGREGGKRARRAPLPPR